MIYLELTFTFFKIGLFSFGGGYAMVPLMEREIAAHGWLIAQEFADIVAISQMTPGPIAVNAATYIGFRVAGIIGSAAATIGVFLPSLILVLLVARFLQKFKASRGVEGILSGIRPATVGLIASAVVFFSQMSILSLDASSDPGASGQGGLGFLGLEPGWILALGSVEIKLPALAIFLVILLGMRKFGLKPIPAVLLSAALGLLLP